MTNNIPGKKLQTTFEGITPIMFDRYAGMDMTLPVDQKFYFADDGKTLVLPSRNIMSFLSAENTISAPKRLYDSKVYKNICRACKSYVSIDEFLIPFVRDGQPMLFNGFGDGQGLTIATDVARLDKGVPNDKKRPVIELPWSLQFTLTLWDNNELDVDKLIEIFVLGGIAVGLGTYRGVYGKFKASFVEL